MPAADELAELRDLQARAYGRGGELNGEDAARLRELERRRRASASASSSPSGASLRLRTSQDASASASAPASASTADVAPASSGEDRRWAARPGVPDGTPTAPAGPVTGSATIAPPSSEEPPALVFPSPLRAMWRPLAALAALMLALGVGLGWVLFERRGVAAMELSAEQQGWQTEILAEGDYDPGSLRAVEEAAGVVAWIATKNSGAQTCLVMSAGERPVPFCTRSEEAQDQGLYGNYSVVRNDIRTDITVQVLFTDDGEPALGTSQYTVDPSSSVGMVYATDEETRIAANLAESGYATNSIWVAGYDGDVPIWSAMLLETQELCLIYDGSTPDPLTACQDPSDLVPGGEGITLSVVDPATGAVTEIEYAAAGPQYLVITKNGGGE